MKQMTTAKLALCSLFTALIAIGAFLQIPLPNFDYFTLQFFFVLMAGMLLGARLGALSAALYVLLSCFPLDLPGDILFSVLAAYAALRFPVSVRHGIKREGVYAKQIQK